MNNNITVRGGGDVSAAYNPTTNFDGTIATPQPKQPNKFLSILKGVGSAVAGFVPGGGIISGLLGAGGPNFGSMNAMIEQSGRQQMQMLSLQHKVSTQGQEFTAVSNLLKARHDSEMSAVNNFKS